MSQTSWLSSTVQPETSSGGQLVTDFETHSTPALSVEETVALDGTYATFQGLVMSQHGTVAFSASDTGINALKRAMGCLILTHLPPQGLDEALQSLHEVWTCYAPRPMVSLPRRLAHTVQGRLGPSTERGPLILEEGR